MRDEGCNRRNEAAVDGVSGGGVPLTSSTERGGYTEVKGSPLQMCGLSVESHYIIQTWKSFFLHKSLIFNKCLSCPESSKMSKIYQTYTKVNLDNGRQ